MSFDNLFKIVIVGASGAGKTSLLVRFVDATFFEQEPTIGVDFRTKDIVVDDKTIRLQIWDTAGQERYRMTLSSSIFKNADGFVIVFDLTSEMSLDQINDFIYEIGQNCEPDVLIVLAGNKCDLKKEIENLEEKIKNISKDHEFELFKTSAKDGTNVNELFHFTAKTLKTNPKLKNKSNIVEIDFENSDDILDSDNQNDFIKKSQTINKKTNCC
ncbi:ras-related protein rab-35 [Anaeramoeba ignava]|uniref:Ras-related protein rab-35 n=1 Tax=Anaeramoeba ignava TaxID=1746090 RepID=A0A9Q0RDX3_ANAIG|nr:ras-related protein rab-35 [Anaeramoeba ignava]